MTDSVPTVPTVWYVNVFVRDFAGAIDFYEKRVGLPLKFRDDSYGYASFETPGAGFAVARVDGDDANSAALLSRHTGIALGVPDLDAAYEAMSARGVEFSMAPTRQAWGGVLATFVDPEGNTLYLDQLRSE